MTPFVSQYNVKGYSYIDTAIIVLYRKKKRDPTNNRRQIFIHVDVAIIS